MIRFFILFQLVLLTTISHSLAQPAPTNQEELLNYVKQKQQINKTSLLKNLSAVNIGPSIMSGRVTAIDVNPKSTKEFYVAYATGGLWYTNNNGTSFVSIMDNAETINIGDIEVDWSTRTIWVGTGEHNSSRSSYSGTGILKTSNQGESWENMGLINSHHIGKILINPENSKEIIVGSTGHLYSESDDRGVYKSTDGGLTWNKTLFIDNMTGIIDMKSSPDNPNVIFASSWTKDRKSWDFNENGSGSAIYKSDDFGNSWSKISTEFSGFPSDSGVGRIGLSVFNENIIYAVVDNQNRRPSDKTENKTLTKEDFKTFSKEDVLKLNDAELDKFLRKNNFDKKYDSKSIKNLITTNEILPVDLFKFLDEANTDLFDTPVIGAEIYKSTDSGLTWKKTHETFIDDTYYSYGYYFGEISVDPSNENTIYVLGVPLLKSIDGGKTFKSISRENVHADHHVLWVNPNDKNHIINGNDGGINTSYDGGENWIKLNHPKVGQFYTVNVDLATPYNVYGGLQDNGVWMAKHNNVENSSWHQNGKYPWTSIMGGDGMQIQIDDRDSNIVITGYQFGHYSRLNLATGQRTNIKPKHKLGESPLRFNWQTPILLSNHNQDILYLGSNKLHRSFDQGKIWEVISEDLTKGAVEGNVPFGTITCISESPLKFGVIVTGSDDGLIHLTKDSGNSWKEISQSLPKDLWISKVIASRHKASRIYACLNGYRWDHFESYIYVSEDYGNSWNRINNNIPHAPVNTLIEDLTKEALLFCGTDNGLYASFNSGQLWHSIDQSLPNVAVHDLVIQPKENDLLIATHGRSIYKLNIKALQKFNLDFKTEKIFDIDPIKYSKNWGNSWSVWRKPFEPEAKFVVFSPIDQTLNFKIYDETNNEVVGNFNSDVVKGFNEVIYDLCLSTKSNKKSKIKSTIAKNGKGYLNQGKYTISSINSSAEFEIK